MMIISRQISLMQTEGMIKQSAVMASVKCASEKFCKYLMLNPKDAVNYIGLMYGSDTSPIKVIKVKG